MQDATVRRAFLNSFMPAHMSRSGLMDRDEWRNLGLPNPNEDKPDDKAPSNYKAPGSSDQKQKPPS